jgi:oligogalacturonide lyase
MHFRHIHTVACLAALFCAAPAIAQMGRTWPSEKKIVPGPVTGLPLTFLTSSASRS